MQNHRRLAACAAVLLPALSASFAAAGVIPHTEDFASGNAAWGTGTDWQLFDPLHWSAGGGPDGSAYVTTAQNFADAVPTGFPLTLFRGQDNFGSSDGAFSGDWLDVGITEFSFWFRHDAPIALNPFARFTPVGSNSPSMNVFFSEFVEANTWTKLTIDISEDNPDFVVGGGPGTYQNVFGNLGKMQLGADVNALVGLDQLVTFDLALVSIAVPGPGAAGMLMFAACAGRRRRRGA